MNNSSKIKVLFVCLGNICRSPLAEGVFQSVLKSYNLEDAFVIDSAGTSNYHVGDLADDRARKVAKQNGIILNHRARQFISQDFTNFDYILVMDHLNYDAVLSISKDANDQQKVFLFRSFDETNIDDYNVPDPYYGGDDDFIEVMEIVSRASHGFIKFLEQDAKISIA